MPHTLLYYFHVALHVFLNTVAIVITCHQNQYPKKIPVAFGAEAEAAARPPHVPAQATAPTMLLAATKTDEGAVKVAVAAPAGRRGACLCGRSVAGDHERRHRGEAECLRTSRDPIQSRTARRGGLRVCMWRVKT